jgi:NAD(P)-dependent dehydrogenase (short-subunit alcohol dehydrogenase family)
MPTTLIIGANRGIGLALAQALRARGHEVIGTCRDDAGALPAAGVRIERDVDVTSDAAVASLAERLGDVTLDWLILNAGILRGDQLATLQIDDVRAQLEANAIGPLRVAKALVPRLRDGGKLALMTSRMGSIGDNSSGGYYGYRMSKAALNAAGVSLARDLRPRGIAVAILHPGMVRTGMTDGQGQVEPDAAARQLIARIDELTAETSGTFWHANGTVLPW